MKIKQIRLPSKVFKNYFLGKLFISLLKKYDQNTSEKILNVFGYYSILTKVPYVSEDTSLEFWNLDEWESTYQKLLPIEGIDTSKLNFLDRVFKLLMRKDLSQITNHSEFSLIKRTLSVMEGILFFFVRANLPNFTTKETINEKNSLPYLTFIPSRDESETSVEEQVSKIQTLTQGLITDFLKQKVKQGFTVKALHDRDSGLDYYKIGEKYVLAQDVNKEYDSLVEMMSAKAKLDLIEDSYDTLKFEDGKLKKGTKLVKVLDFLDSETLEKKIGEFKYVMFEYNQKLKDYEKSISNEPIKINLGTYTFNTQKVLFKGIVRPVIIDGPFKGLFLDEMVSSTGKVLGSKAEVPYGFLETKRLVNLTRTLPEEQVQTKTVFQNVMLPLVNTTNPYTLPTKFDADTSLINDHIIDEIKVEDGKFAQFLKIPENMKLFRDALGIDMALAVDNKNIENVSNTASRIQQDRGQMDQFAYAHENEITRGGVPIVFLNRVAYFTYSASGAKPLYIYNASFQTNPGIPEGFGNRVLMQQVRAASKLGFEYIKTDAAKAQGMVGYYVWPKLGYNAAIDINVMASDPRYNDLIDWLKEHEVRPKGRFSYDILDVYACKVKGKFIGQEMWRAYGNTTTMIFDLKPNSLSMRVLNEYLKTKALVEGTSQEDYLQIDYSKYNNIFYKLQEVALNIYTIIVVEKQQLTPQMINQIGATILKEIRNDNYKILFRFVNKISNYAVGSKKYNFTSYLTGLGPIWHSLISYLKSKNVDNSIIQRLPRTASEILPSEFGEIDMKVLDLVWDNINKLYEKGLVK